MNVLSSLFRRRRRRRPGCRSLRLERLEPRILLNGAVGDVAHELTGGGPLGADGYEPNNSFALAEDLGLVTGEQDFTGLSIDPEGDEDYYKFQTREQATTSHYVEIHFAHVDGNLDMRLYDVSQSLLAFSRTVTDNERIPLAQLPTGTYYVHVYGYEDETNDYDLTIVAPQEIAEDAYESNDSFADATDLGPVAGMQQVAGLTIHPADDEDYLQFEIGEGATSSHYAEIHFAHVDGDLDMRLYNSNRSRITTAQSVDDDETVELGGLDAGVYYLKVNGYDGATNSYDLTIEAPGQLAADGSETNDSFAQATDLGLVSGEEEVTDLTIYGAGDADYFRFAISDRATSSHYVEIAFAHADGDLDMTLYDADENYVSGARSVTNNERLSLRGLEAGTYYLRVEGYDDANTNAYDLAIVAPGDMVPDYLEPNDAFDGATNLGPVSGEV